MIPKYFDIHSHLNFADFDKDKEDVIRRALDAMVWIIIVGTDFESSKKAIEIAEKYNEGVYASVGIHPSDVDTVGNKVSGICELAQHPKVVAIGECGLDFQIPKDSPLGILQGESLGTDLPRQIDIFKQQIELTIELDKPLMVHCRDSHNDVLEILNSYKCPELRGDIHFFSGSLEQAEKYFELGFAVSFTGVITFPPSFRETRDFGRASARDYDKIIRNAPLDKIMIETDAPFVAPIPYRGKRNEPSYVIEVAKKIAEIRGISKEEAAKITTANALKLFRI